MKRKIAVIVVLLLLFSVVIADTTNPFYFFYTELDWFSIEEAEKAPIPEGLTAREEEIYRAGFANGHYEAMNPPLTEGMFVLNNKTHKFHLSNCMTTLAIEIENREHTTKSAEELIAEGYKPCGMCNPVRTK